MKTYKTLIIIASLLLLAPSLTRGGEESYSSFLRGDNIREDARLKIAYPLLNAPEQVFEYSRVRVKLYLAEDRNTPHEDTDIRLRYTLWMVAMNNTVETVSEEITVSYRKDGFYADINLFEYNNHLYKSATLNIDRTVGNITPDVILELQLTGKRNCNITSLPVSIPAPGHLEHRHIDTLNELLLVWGYVDCAESYDVEWLFIDNPRFENGMEYDFKNATRINTTANHYRISLAYPAGNILYRVRGTGNYQGESFPGTWAGAAPYGKPLPSSYRFDYGGLEKALNWQYTAAYSENGKRKEVITFYDGTFRTRQQVTVFNTHDIAIIGETFYDHVGRPALQSIPAPTTGKGIRYYGTGDSPAGNFNGKIAKTDYDTDRTIASPAPFPADAGSVLYHSLQNPFLDQSQYPNAENIPADEKGYLYSHTRYRNDGTGRVHSVSPPGTDFQLGSGREIRYYYGNPTQAELDRLFGNEAGDASHYQKVITLDANEMSTVSYYDMKERLIASSLSSGGKNLLPVDSVPEPEMLSETLYFDDESREHSQTLTVSGTVDYTFTYRFDPADPFHDECKGKSGTMPCSYRIVFSLWNPDQKKYVFRYDQIVDARTEITEHATLATGNYLLYKSVTLSEASLEEKLQQYGERQAGCVSYTVVEPDPCYSICEKDCMDSLGLKFPDYKNPQFAECVEQCENPPVTYQSECEAKYASMLRDMSPGGQYFDNIMMACPPDSNEATYNPQYRNDFLARIDQSYLSYNPWIRQKLTDFGIGASDPQRYPKLWDSLRVHWEESYAVEMFAFHPEKPMYDFFCACGDAAAQRKWENLFMNTNTYKEAEKLGLFNPLNLPTDTETYIQKDSNIGYMPLPYPSGNPDPYFESIDRCCKGREKEIQGWITARLNTYFNWENDYGTIYFGSVWYLLFDPEQMAQGKDPYGKEIQELFASFHLETLPYMANEYGVSLDDARWMLFRNIYLYLKKEAQAHFFKECGQQQTLYKDTLEMDQTAWHQGKYPYEALDDCRYYLFADPDCQNKPLTKEGYEIRFLCNPIFGLDRENYNKMRDIALQDLLSDCELDCEAYAGEWMRQLNDYLQTFCPEMKPGSQIWENLKSELTRLCYEGCDRAYNDGDFSREQRIDIANYLELLSNTGCDIERSPPIIIYPQDGEHYIDCGCNQFQTYLNNEELTFWSETEKIDKALQNGEIKMEEIPFWLEFCKKDRYEWMLKHHDDTTIWKAYGFPEEFRCSPPDEDWRKQCMELARLNANALNAQAKGEAVASLIDERRDAYFNNCMAKIRQDQLDIAYASDEYLFTLYYYDQADNLIKTVPPRGVALIRDADKLKQVRTYRETVDSYEDMDGFIHPAHAMITNYRYNTLDQPVQSSIPDHDGLSLIYYDILSRPVLSQNAEQKQRNAYTYTLYDAIGRITETGQIMTDSIMNEEKARDTAQVKSFIENARHRYEVTKTFYDRALLSHLEQKRLRNRIAAISFSETYDENMFNYQTATHYSYDVQGNVGQVIQNIRELEPFGLDTIRIDYQYDLISGNVKKVWYRKGHPDQFIHRYRYDADNRLTHVYTSGDGILWHAEARYFYYPHGALARMELGEKQVQGIDYAYTLNGWLRAINTIFMTPETDPGKDGMENHSHGIFAKDAFAHSLQYYKNDYVPVRRPPVFFLAYLDTNDLFNGNIAASVANTRLFPTMLKHYRYDKLNRIKVMQTAEYNEPRQEWEKLTDRYSTHYEYDYNGNILYLRRANQDMEPRHELTYKYEKEGQNRLTRLNSSDDDRIRSSSYQYDRIGNLIQDEKEGTEIGWNSMGKVRNVKTPEALTEFAYAPLGQRQIKRSDNQNQYYIHDATGNVMAIYHIRSGNVEELSMPIYGSSRLGTYTYTDAAQPGYTRHAGLRQYELADHLGNVNAVISDRKTEQMGSSQHLLYEPVYLSATDYYPFGFPIEERSMTSNYRYGFNGQEKDNEIYGEGASLGFEARMYDSRLGKWFSLDPLQMKYSDLSPYSFTANNPILFKDPNGKEIWVGNIQYQPPQNRDAAYIEQIANSDDFTRMTFEALDYLHTHGVENGVNRVQNIVDANTKLIIYENIDYPGNDGYEPWGRTLKYSHDVAVEMDGGEKFAPVVTLAHELDHAEKSILAYDIFYEAVKNNAPEAIQDDLFSKAVFTQGNIDPEQSAMQYGNFIIEKLGGTFKRTNYVELPLRFYFSKGALSTEENKDIPADRQEKINKSNKNLENEREK